MPRRREAARIFIATDQVRLIQAMWNGTDGLSTAEVAGAAGVAVPAACDQMARLRSRINVAAHERGVE